MRVLVDTSVWIRFLVGREPWCTGLQRLLSKGRVLGHDFVLGELLVGDTGNRAEALALYTRMAQARRATHAEAVALVRSRRLSGRGIGWLDAHLLASALVERVPLWTADRPLAAVAVALDVAFVERHTS